MGLHDVPQAGDLFMVEESNRKARAIVEQRKQDQEQALARESKSEVTLEQLFDRFQAGDVRELRLIVKADVQGSLEPIVSSLNVLGSGDISLNILHAETGNVSESDIMLAAASKAIVIGFNVEADTASRRLADSESVSIRLYDIIYRLTEDVEKALKGMLEPELKETVLGQAEVRAVFRISKVGKVAGCRVIEGELQRNAQMRVLRDNQVIFDGEIASLKHHQDDVREIRQGFECGIALKDYNKFEENDILECYIVEEVEMF
jgi:translation initiation factor IF-2